MKLTFWRTKDGEEVDFIIGDKIAIEVKATQKIQKNYIEGLKKLQVESVIKNFYLFSQDPIELLSEQYLAKLWNGEII